jgi:hypothetical protein
MWSMNVRTTTETSGERTVPASRETVSKLHFHAPIAPTPALSSTNPVRAVGSVSASVMIKEGREANQNQSFWTPDR